MKRIFVVTAFALTALSLKASACVEETERNPIHTCGLWWDGHISDEVAQALIAVRDGELRDYCAKTRP